MKLKTPNQIKILGRTFSIVNSKTTHDDYGETEGAAGKIVIDHSKHTSQEELDSTLLHEIIHGILYISGQAETLSEHQEEGLVIALENGLRQIYSLTLKK
jgi:hypothetical protein